MSDAAVDELARSVDDEIDAVPLEDVPDASPLVDVKYIAGLVKSPQPFEFVSTTKVMTAAETVSESATECKDGTCPAPSVIADVANKKTAASECADGKCSAPRTLGTLIEWAPTAEDAGKVASKADKLVFLMQVSGNFARQEFT